MTSPVDAVADFLGAMEAAGVRPLDEIGARLSGGGLIRFRADGDKPGRQNGWAVLYLNGTPAGAFGSYKLGVSERWRSGTPERLTPFERRERAEQWRKVQRERHAAIERGWSEASAYAHQLLARSATAEAAHPYLIRKGIGTEGMRQLGEVLLVPMRNSDGDLWNVQRIAPDGTKRFLKGGRTSGLFWRCGDPDAVLCLGEGVGTMAAIRRATGHSVVAAFSEKNLIPVAQAIAVQFPDADLIICADDDAHLVDHPTIKRNLGLDAARAAAAAVGARVAVPPRSEHHG